MGLGVAVQHEHLEAGVVAEGVRQQRAALVGDVILAEVEAAQGEVGAEVHGERA